MSSGQGQGHRSKKIANICSCIDQFPSAIFTDTRPDGATDHASLVVTPYIRLEGSFVINSGYPVCEKMCCFSGFTVVKFLDKFWPTQVGIFPYIFALYFAVLLL